MSQAEVGDTGPACVDPSWRKEAEDRDSALAISLLSPQAWGLQIIYKSVKLPVLKVGSMLLETP